MTVWVLGKYGFNLSSLLGRGRGRGGARARRCSSPGNSTARRRRARSTSSRSRWPSSSAPPACRTCSCASTPCRPPRRPAIGGLGDLADRHLLPVHAGPRLRRGGARRRRRRSTPRPARSTRRPRCSPTSSAATVLLGHHLRGRLRDDPRRRRRPDHHRGAPRFAHDIYARSSSGARRRPDDEVRVARGSPPLVIGIVAIVGGIFANGQNVAFLVALAFAVAACANLPTILYSLFWKRFNTTGALWSIYGGLASRHRPHRLLPGRLGQAETVDASMSGRGLPLVPAGQPGHRLDPGVVPAGRGRDHGRRRADLARGGGRARPAGRRDGGPLDDRRRDRRPPGPCSSPCRTADRCSRAPSAPCDLMEPMRRP